MKNKSRMPLVASALVIAVGAAVVWGLGLGIVSQFANSLLSAGPSVRESLHVTEDGTVLIDSVSWNSQVEGRHTYRTLEGDEVELGDQQASLYLARLQLPQSDERLFEHPVPWAERIGATSDHGNPATYWFLIRDPSRENNAYFLVIDSVTQRTIGYLGRQGFQETPPDADDLFVLSGRRAGYSPAFYASTGYMERANVYPNLRHSFASVDDNPKRWIGFLLDHDRIWQIDLRERKISTFHETDDALSISMISELVRDDVQENGADAAAEPSSPDEAERRRKSVRRLAVRHNDRVEVWNVETGGSKSFPLPERVAQVREIGVLSLGDGRLLADVNRGWWDRGVHHEILWLDQTEGEIRSADLRLAGFAPPSRRKSAWTAAAIVPSPLALGFIGLVMAPMGVIEMRQASTYQEALAICWSDAWLPFLVVLVVSAALAAIVLRLHRQLFATNQSIWAIVVLLLGIPGCIAWRLCNAKPPLATCRDCGRKVRRDRSLCSHCADPFPEPALRGTEVFA